LRDADLRLHDRRQHFVPARRRRRSRLAGGAAIPGRLEERRLQWHRDLSRRQRRPALRRRIAETRRTKLAEGFLMATASQLIVVADAGELARTATERVMARIAKQSGRIAICLTGGSGPKLLYQALGSEARRGKIPWERVHWFIGDERFVAESDPLNNMTVARDIFLDGNAPTANIHPIPTAAEGL